MYITSSYIKQLEKNGDDSLWLLERDSVIGFCIADGAGGSGAGKEASLRIAERFRNWVSHAAIKNSDCVEGLLKDIDAELYKDLDCGESTAVIGLIIDNEIIGASVGDSECWIYYDDKGYEVTQFQNRKPLLGSGESEPIGFGPLIMGNHAIVGSDGFFNYVNLFTVIDLLKNNLDVEAKDIAVYAQNKAGKYSDDVSLIYFRKVG